MKREEKEERVFTYDDLKRYTEDFKDKLGEGGYGNVYKGRVPADNPYGLLEQEIAVKLTKDPNGVEATQFDFEIHWLKRFQHEGIIEFLGVEREMRCIVLKLVRRGNLSENLEDLSWTETLSILKQIASTISYVHSIGDGVVIGDVKLQNILLDEGNITKLCDFGSTREEGDELAPFTVGTVDTHAGNQDMGRGGDVYSFGIIILQMIMKSKTPLLEVKAGQEVDPCGNRDRQRIGKVAEARLRSETHVVHDKLLRSGCTLPEAIKITELAMELTRLPEMKGAPNEIKNTWGKLMKAAEEGLEYESSNYTGTTASSADEVNFISLDEKKGGDDSEIQPVEQQSGPSHHHHRNSPDAETEPIIRPSISD